MSAVELTKWPRLLVVGEPVTQQQANEILVRTDSWRLCTNDRVWEAAVNAAAAQVGAPIEPPWSLAGDERRQRFRAYHDALNAWRKFMGVLDLHYLHNDRIASSWIGGPHGWCDWDGVIGCTTYNIGKWPTVDAVHDDWVAIAAAFPYLTLRAQLVPDEGETGEPVVEWRIAGGVVEQILRVNDERQQLPQPLTLITEPEDLPSGVVLQILAGHSRERGVELARLRAALQQVHRSQQAAACPDPAGGGESA